MKLSYRPEVDGLRAIAVVPVILFHAGFASFSGGFVGVDVFFVISGYLITSIIINELAQRNFSLLAFYERRARRILPALMTVVLASLPVAWFWLLPEHMKNFMQSIVGVATFSSNVLFWLESGYFDAAAELKPMLHTWSLAVEEQFYILFPLLLMLSWRAGFNIVIAIFVCLFLVSLGLAEWMVQTDPSFAFFMLPTRAWELLIGSFTAIMLFRQPAARRPSLLGNLAALAGLGAVLGAVFVYSSATPFPSFYALVPTLGSGLVIVFAVQGSWVANILSARLLVGTGLISYSLYLWHMPVFVFARHRSLTELSPQTMLALILLVFLLSWMTWKYVERPFRERQRFTRRRVFVMGGLISCVVASVGIAGHATDGWGGRLTADQAALATIRKLHTRQREDNGCNMAGKSVALGGCVHGASVSPTYALLGDSHATTIVHTLASRFSDNDLSFVQYTKNGCPFAFDFRTAENRRCAEYYESAAADIRQRGITTLIVYSRWAHYLYDTDYRNGLGGVEHVKANTYSTLAMPYSEALEKRRDAILNTFVAAISTFADEGRRVLIIGTTPSHAWDVPSQLAKRTWLELNAGTLPSLSLDVYANRVRVAHTALRAMTAHANVQFLDPAPVFCSMSKKLCAPVRQGQALYYDDDHLSNAGAQLLVDELWLQIASLPR